MVRLPMRHSAGMVRLALNIRWFATGKEPADFKIAQKTYRAMYAIDEVKGTPNKFVDHVNIEVRGGKGGNGCISFDALSPGKKRPNGGNGGAGGNVYIVADRNRFSFDFQVSHFNGKPGGNGGANGMTGKHGEDTYVYVPCGTIVSEKMSPQILDYLDEQENYDFDERDLPTITLEKDKAKLLVASGGRPGLGNKVFAGTQERRGRSAPATRRPGGPGQVRQLYLELKIIADVGLVGYPNAGKSTLLKCLSKANPLIAPYPFSTLHPNIGVVMYSDDFRVSVADIPGLIEGAHEDRGLGHDFLKHIEKTKMLLFVLDGSGFDGHEPAVTLKNLLSELRKYDKKLLKKPGLVFANKSDIKLPKKSLTELEEVAHRHGMHVLTGSGLKGENIGQVAAAIRMILHPPAAVPPIIESSSTRDTDTTKSAS